MNSASQSWTDCFELIEAQGATIVSYAATMRVTPVDVYSGLLPKTRAFSFGNEDGSLRIMCASNRIFTFRELMEVLAVLATHNRIARMRGVHMINGGTMYRVRRDSDVGHVTRRVPVMPIKDLARMTNIDEMLLRSVISPMIQDGAIKLVINKSDQQIGLMLEDGFINDEPVKRFFCH